ncbi:MAG: PucR family transcriptional regulator [Brevibacterium yomogidense]
MERISNLVESLAQSLRRSVAVDDPDLHLIAHSTHFGDADPARLQSLANRRMEGPVRDATFAAGFHQWTRPRRGRALGVHGHEYDRMSFPLRARQGLIGVMWVIIKDADLTDDEMAQCLTVAAEVERILAGQQARESQADRETEALILRVLSSEPSEVTEALAGLVSSGVLDEARDRCAYVFRLGGDGGDPVDDDARSTMRRAIRQTIEARTGAPAALAFTEAGAFALAGASPGDGPAERVRTAERIIAEAVRLDSTLHTRIHAGVGTLLEGPGSVPASYGRAATASRVAVRDGKPVVAWELRPLDALLDAVVRTEVQETAIPALLLRLDATHSEETLRTVSCFLDEAGSVARVSALLHLHRTTVYYRLKVFEKETGLSLASGRDRLLLHLWLSVRRDIAFH